MRLIRQRFELNGIETYRSWINKPLVKLSWFPVRYTYVGLGRSVSGEEFISTIQQY